MACPPPPLPTLRLLPRVSASRPDISLSSCVAVRSLPRSAPFQHPVGPELKALGLDAEYNRAVGRRMDLRTLRNNLLKGNYTSPEAFAKDLALIWHNCMVR